MAAPQPPTPLSSPVNTASPPFVATAVATTRLRNGQVVSQSRRVPVGPRPSFAGRNAGSSSSRRRARCLGEGLPALPEDDREHGQRGQRVGPPPAGERVEPHADEQCWERYEQTQVSLESAT